jgi:pimeloyl-ACP methyl ester carboxylesterase
MISTTSTRTWTGMVPVDDTALAVTDSCGSGTPVVYLNGQFATQGYWRRVIAELGPDWRHLRYDERARGRKSGRSADYSFEAAVRDVGAVLDARDVDRALVVGWSYGAFVAAHWTSRNPDRTIGAVLVDGAQPHDWLMAAGRSPCRRTRRPRRAPPHPRGPERRAGDRRRRSDGPGHGTAGRGDDRVGTGRSTAAGDPRATRVARLESTRTSPRRADPPGSLNPPLGIRLLPRRGERA